MEKRGFDTEDDSESDEDVEEEEDERMPANDDDLEADEGYVYERLREELSPLPPKLKTARTADSDEEDLR